MTSEDKEKLVLVGLLLTTVGILYTVNQNNDATDDLDDLTIWGKLLFLWTCCAAVMVKKKEKVNSDYSSLNHSLLSNQ